MKITTQVENQFAVLAEEMLKDMNTHYPRHILLSMEFSMWLVRNALLHKSAGLWLFGCVPTCNQPFKPFTYVLLK